MLRKTEDFLRDRNCFVWWPGDANVNSRRTDTIGRQVLFSFSAQRSALSVENAERTRLHKKLSHVGGAFREPCGLFKANPACARPLVRFHWRPRCVVNLREFK